MVNFKKIERLARIIREELEIEMGTDDIAGLCAYACDKLSLYLRYHFIEADIIKGTFTIDSPNPEFYPDELEDCEQIYYPPHYWLEVNGYIIDITADQFNCEIDDELMPKILIGTYKEFSRYKKLKVCKNKDEEIIKEV